MLCPVPKLLSRRPRAVGKGDFKVNKVAFLGLHAFRNLGLFLFADPSLTVLVWLFLILSSFRVHVSGVWNRTIGGLIGGLSRAEFAVRVHGP